MVHDTTAPNPASLGRQLRAMVLLCGVVFAALVNMQAQSPLPTVPTTVEDAQGAPIPNATVRSASGQLLGTTDPSGRVAIACAAPCPVVVQAAGFAPRHMLWHSGASITLDLASIATQISVTAYRTPLGDLESPASTRILTPSDLRESAPAALDGQLRLLPGVETFRRSSSLVANPSSQGLSLRGLGSTSASRTLVTQDDVPLNDGFAGWIHWEELPELSIHSIELVRGGASDLYGSSAIGGVINILPQRPTQDLFELKSSYAGENTYQDDALLSATRNHWGLLATGGTLGTDGFILTAPDQRGSVDVPSNVHAQNGVVLLDRRQGSLRLFTRASTLNEARPNGTPVQTNGTRIWRYATGTDWSAPHDGNLVFRLYGSTEHYRQTFSTIAASRNFETLNRFAKTPDNELGAVLHWSQPLLTGRFGPGLLLLAGADTHDIRANDQEAVIKAGVQSAVNQSDRQRQTGAYAELLFTRQAWTLSGSGRLDWFSNFDGLSWTASGAVGKPTPLPSFSEKVFDPRLGVSRKLGAHFALSATGFRAYRAPTANELYRSTQVGSLLTLPNNNLRSERATGWETGIAMEQRWGTVRASYFWNRVNRPITALTTNPSSNPILLMRENLGRIESRGLSLDAEFQPTRWMTVQGGYQYTNATVTQYRLPDGTQSSVVGNWIPQVAHNMATAQLRAYRPSIGTLSLQSRISGRQFDDDANTYLLHSYFKLDVYASHDFGKRLEFFTSAENLFDRSIEVGRTPTLTLGTPRMARIGFLLKLSPAAR